MDSLFRDLGLQSEPRLTRFWAYNEPLRLGSRIRAKAWIRTANSGLQPLRSLVRASGLVRQSC